MKNTNDSPVGNFVAMVAVTPGIHPDFIAGMRSQDFSPARPRESEVAPTVPENAKLFPLGGPLGARAFLIVEYLIEVRITNGATEENADAPPIGKAQGILHPCAYTYAVQFWPDVPELRRLESWSATYVPAYLERIAANGMPTPEEIGWTESDLRAMSGD